VPFATVYPNLPMNMAEHHAPDVRIAILGNDALRRSGRVAWIFLLLLIVRAACTGTYGMRQRRRQNHP
jgi:hypothetical protein